VPDEPEKKRPFPTGLVHRFSVAERRQRVATMLREHMRVSDIADELGIHHQTIRMDIRWIMEETRHDTLGAHEDNVASELLHLLDYQRALYQEWARLRESFDCEDWLPIYDRWLATYDRMLKTAERRAKLMGLDATGEARLDLVQMAQIVTRFVAIFIAAATPEIVKVVLPKMEPQIEELLGQFGAGLCERHALTENAGSPESSSPASSEDSSAP